jgi:uncharacterized protein (TIGR03083 family)
MSMWNAMSPEGKDNIINVVRTEAERMFAMADRPEAWDQPTACEGWSTRDIIAHIVDTTEGYFRAFDAARGMGQVPAPFGLSVMHEKVDAFASELRDIPQAQLMDRLKTDFHKMQEILKGLTDEEWTSFMVTHAYMGPVPSFFYAAGQLMDYGVHSWDIRQGTGKAHGLPGDTADLLVPFMFAIWQGTIKPGAVTQPFTIGIRVSTGHNAGDYRVSVTDQGMTYEPGEIENLPGYIEFDAGSLVLTAFGRGNFGTVRGDFDLAERYLNLFFRI